MTVSVFDLFKPGIGPSSSHTMGPMQAALMFARHLQALAILAQTARITVTLHGSLAATGRGHGTDAAVQLGLGGGDPASWNPDDTAPLLARILDTQTLSLLGLHPVRFIPADDIVWDWKVRLPFHSNALRLTAHDGSGHELATKLYYSVGGGFVVDESEAGRNALPDEVPPPHDYRSADDLLAQASVAGLSIAELTRANERTWRSDAEIDAGLDMIWSTMNTCIDRGLVQDGILPGHLKVPRRARRIHDNLRLHPEKLLADPLATMDFINVWALAVNEENAAGGRVVTAPTNGAAGIIPAVIRYYTSCRHGTVAGIRTFLLTAAAIGGLYKRNASISGAEVGCQGEVGVACSMAAGGLTAALGGSNAQIENAAEIGMEHNLGLTCDPIGGLVQIPCIERNAMGAIKAIDASRLALLGDGTHFVSLDKVIATMRATGADMQEKYKETSTGGLAVNVVEC
jgi:L-serine dehydratase